MIKQPISSGGSSASSTSSSSGYVGSDSTVLTPTKAARLTGLEQEFHKVIYFLSFYFFLHFMLDEWNEWMNLNKYFSSQQMMEGMFHSPANVNEQDRSHHQHTNGNDNNGHEQQLQQQQQQQQCDDREKEERRRAAQKVLGKQG